VQLVNPLPTHIPDGVISIDELPYIKALDERSLRAGAWIVSGAQRRKNEDIARSRFCEMKDGDQKDKVTALERQF